MECMNSMKDAGLIICLLKNTDIELVSPSITLVKHLLVVAIMKKIIKTYSILILCKVNNIRTTIHQRIADLKFVTKSSILTANNGLVTRIVLDFNVENISEVAKASQEPVYESIFEIIMINVFCKMSYMIFIASITS